MKHDPCTGSNGKFDPLSFAMSRLSFTVSTLDKFNLLWWWLTRDRLLQYFSSSDGKDIEVLFSRSMPRTSLKTQWYQKCQCISYHVPSCLGLKELLPQTAHPMSIIWVSYIGDALLIWDVKLYLVNQDLMLTVAWDRPLQYSSSTDERDIQSYSVCATYVEHTISSRTMIQGWSSFN